MLPGAASLPSSYTNWERKLPAHVVQRLAGHVSVSTTLKHCTVMLPADLEAAARVTEEAVRVRQDAPGTQ